MPLDERSCVIRPPRSDELPALYAFLSDCFPTDRPLFDELRRTGRKLYTWTPTACWTNGRIVGSAALMPVRVWLGGQAVELVGVASVATAPEHRRQGIARRLLERVLQSVDERALSSVLFTGVPDVYRSLGFQPTAQHYLVARAELAAFCCDGFDEQVCTELAPQQIERLAALYERQYPNYDGKVVRDADYWWLYAALLRFTPHSQALLCSRRGELLGYARFDRERDRITITELCAKPAAADVAEALLGFLQRQARQADAEWLSLALPPQHFAWSLLQGAAVALQEEPPGANRETFMVRPSCSAADSRLLRLQWSLADKF